MIIYNLLIVDRHSDPEIKNFIDKDKAIEEAKRIAKKHARDESDYKETNFENCMFMQNILVKVIML